MPDAAGAGSVLTVTPNPALDVSYRVDRLTVHAEHRVVRVREVAGGKGLNVARVLRTLGRPVTVTGLTSGAAGDAVRAGARAAGLDERFVHVEAQGQSRRTVVVVDDDGPTSFWEPGPVVDPAALGLLAATVAELSAGAAAVAVCGSLPPGLPDGTAAELAGAARDRGARTIVDAGGAALRLAAAAGCVLKSNEDELAAAVGRPAITGDDVRAAARTLLDAGATAVVVTRGRRGCLAVTERGAWSAHPPADVTGNATGAGDAFTAALLDHLADLPRGAALDWPVALREATALSAAAVLQPVAGEVDAAAYRRWVSRVVVETL